MATEYKTYHDNGKLANVFWTKQNDEGLNIF